MIIFALILVAVVVLWVFMVYNGLIKRRNQVRESWADIEVQLKRRYDLIPNLIESVKGYVKQEQDVLVKVTEARAQAVAAGAHASTEQVQAENMLSQSLRSLFAVAESYPDLKSSANFTQLSSELSDTENKLAAARRFYNTTVRDYNTSRQLIPASIIAGPMGFQDEVFFDLPDSDPAQEAVKVSF
jgi:LemA protein